MKSEPIRSRRTDGSSLKVLFVSEPADGFALLAEGIARVLLPEPVTLSRGVFGTVSIPPGIEQALREGGFPISGWPVAGNG